MIEPDRIKIEKEKVQEVVDWLVPKSVKDVQKFLELVNYYRQFVKTFVKVAKSLHEMMRKITKSILGAKKRFMTELFLVTPDLDKKIRVKMSRTKEVDLNFSYFLYSFLFSF